MSSGNQRVKETVISLTPRDSNDGDNAPSAPLNDHVDTDSECESQPFLQHPGSNVDPSSEKLYTGNLDSKGRQTGRLFDTRYENISRSPASTSGNVSGSDLIYPDSWVLKEESSLLPGNQHRKPITNEIELLGSKKYKAKSNGICLLKEKPFQSVHPFRRTVSLDNILSDQVEKLNTDRQRHGIAYYHSASGSPVLVAKPDNRAASLNGICTSQNIRTSTADPLSNFHGSNSYRISKSYSSSWPESAQDVSQPTRLWHGALRNSSSQHEYVSPATPINLSHIQPGFKAQQILSSACSNGSSSAQMNYGHYSSVSQPSHESTLMRKLHSATIASMDDVFKNNSLPGYTVPRAYAGVNSTTKTPTQNLESVLGYGTPLSQSVLKHPSQQHSIHDQKSLQVLVPRNKDATEGANTKHLDKFSNSLFKPSEDKSSQNGCPLLPVHENHKPYYNNAPLRRDLTSVFTVPEEESRFYLEHETSDITHDLALTPGSSTRWKKSCSPSLLKANQQSSLYGGDLNMQQQPFPYGRDNNMECRLELRDIGHTESYPLMLSELSEFEPIDKLNLGRSSSHSREVNSQIKDSDLTVDHQSVTYDPFATDGVSKSPVNLADLTTSRANTLYAYKYSPVGYANSAQASTSYPEHHQKCILSINPHGDEMLSVTPHYSHFVSSHANPCQQIPSQSTSSHPHHVTYPEEYEIQVRNHDLTKGNDVIVPQIEDKGYKPGMMITVPKACFESNFLESQDVTASNRGTIRHSMLSTAESGHKEGSLQRSNTSDFGLWKPTCEGTSDPGCHSRRKSSSEQLWAYTAVKTDSNIHQQ